MLVLNKLFYDSLDQKASTNSSTKMTGKSSTRKVDHILFKPVPNIDTIEIADDPETLVGQPIRRGLNFTNILRATFFFESDLGRFFVVTDYSNDT